jgi:hypothetical protein
MLCKEIIAVSSEYRTKLVYTSFTKNGKLLIVKSDGTYRDH